MLKSNNLYVIFSATQAAASDGAGFWSGDNGWRCLESVKTFSPQEMLSVRLPLSTDPDAKWMPWNEANAIYGPPAKETFKARLTLDVTYTLNGENSVEMISRLRRMCEQAIGEGMLTGESDAEVEQHSIDVVIRPEPISEEKLSSFMLQRIESGGLALEDIPVRLAQYGLMEPHAFVDEMRERIENGKSGSWSVALAMENGTKFEWTGSAEDQSHAEGQAIAYATAQTGQLALSVVHVENI